VANATVDVAKKPEDAVLMVSGTLCVNKYCCKTAAITKKILQQNLADVSVPRYPLFEMDGAAWINVGWSAY
jgi:hypothetical protein